MTSWNLWLVSYLELSPGALQRWRRQSCGALSLFPSTSFWLPPSWKITCYKSDYSSGESNEKSKVCPEILCLNTLMPVITADICILSISFLVWHSWRDDRSRQLCMSHSWSEISAMDRIYNEYIQLGKHLNIAPIVTWLRRELSVQHWNVIIHSVSG